MTGVSIPPLDRQAQEEARRRWDNLTKPVGSLGRLEELGIRIAGITGRPSARIRRKVIFTVAADHGVVAEGVSAYPQEVTLQMVANFLRGGAGINVLARHVGAEVLVVDAGIAGSPDSADGLIHAKVRPGTGNMARGPAMDRAEAEQAIRNGIRIFDDAHRERAIDLVGLGDMGIGNTTASTALTAALTGAKVSEVTGRGTGLVDQQLRRKVQVIEKVLALHRPDPSDPLDCLAKVGGLEIACLAGIALAGAQARVPVVLDGFITSAAALVACRIAPGLSDHLIASHRSVEPGHRILLESMGLVPLFDLQMRLGEGTGAALAFSLVEASLKLLSEMATFSEALVSGPAGSDPLGSDPKGSDPR
ncbi:MAG: nicotinate-nucleotide--dimethylbenzimidazole phosphoribosyltransferase [Candidatus Omnitrophica bacterium]|nr:nicotinate-nucleotide--dimethylbenzimidazole phosphoribosyltransferase [Candidatus Omnitrophota bacterium]